MPNFQNERDYVHGTHAQTGVLLVNLGTPEAPTPAAVRRYLAQFLWDPRVIELPRPLWWLVLHGVILRIRPRRSAAAYRQIWTEAGSPLRVLSQALTGAVAGRLAARRRDPPAVVLAMTYGEPSIPAALEALRARNVRRLLVLPLFPQYSATTTGAVFDQVAAALSRRRWLPELRFVTGYHDDPAWIAAVADSLRGEAGRGHLLFSFHGLPRRYLDAGDPYHCQCQASARRIAARLGLADADWSVSFQSRVGREPWLQPYTDERLRALPGRGTRRVTVVCPGFAVDCLETLEEIAIRGREDFLAAGGESFGYVPALNDGAAHADCLAGLIERQLAGWPDAPPDPDAAAAAAARARALGAAR